MIHWLLDIARDHMADYGYLWLFLAGCLEGEVFITVLVGLGQKAGLSVVGMSAAAGTGAVLFDLFFYTLGRKYHEHIRSLPFFSTHLTDDKLEHLRAFYKKYGGITVILTRFVYGTRSLGATVAGMSDMTLVRFMFYNCVGAVLWVLVFVGGVYRLAQTHELMLSMHALSLALAVLALLFLLSWWGRKKLFGTPTAK